MPYIIEDSSWNFTTYIISSISAAPRTLFLLCGGRNWEGVSTWEQERGRTKENRLDLSLLAPILWHLSIKHFKAPITKTALRAKKYKEHFCLSRKSGNLRSCLDVRVGDQSITLEKRMVYFRSWPTHKPQYGKYPVKLRGEGPHYRLGQSR